MLKQLKSKKLKNRILKILTENPSNRDDDNRLLCNVWYYEFHEQFKKHPSEVDAMQFFKLLSIGRFTKSESVRRLRQKIQEENPHLRGVNYRERQNHAKKIRKEINS
jgi:hypothetical protein